jgi:adenosylcobinamide kinase/adenosylcobinamide-phosphate guanylyltransferase
MQPLPGLTLVLGGARSGKSAHAESLVLASGLEPVYVATAQALDAEMAARIARHRADRGPAWRTVEEPLELAARVALESRPGRAVLVDCLTLWLTNLMVAGRDVPAACATLVAGLRAPAGPVVLVSNEVGWGIVPETPLGRRFRDAQGRLNQRMAAVADRVVLVVAGIPVAIKGAVA